MFITDDLKIRITAFISNEDLGDYKKKNRKQKVRKKSQNKPKIMNGQKNKEYFQYIKICLHLCLL